MSSSRAVTLMLAALMAAGAHAQSGRTREQVKAELAEAIRTGDMLGNGESGFTLRQLNPRRYGVVAAPASTLTRAQVNAEVQEARRSGDLIAGGELGLPLNELQPGAFAPRPAIAGKTRAEVQAELREAIRTGDMLADGESGRLLKDVFPQRYAKVKPPVDGPLQAATPSATPMQ
jgi:hypothetical protein